MPTLPIPDELVFKQPPRIDSSIIFNQVQLAFLVPFLSAISFGVICVPSLPSTLEHLRVGASDGVILSPRDFTPMPTLPIPDELVFKQPPRIDSSIILNQVQLAFLVPFLPAISFGVICVPSLPSTLEHLRVSVSDGVILSPRDFTPMPTLPIPDELVFKQPPRIDSSIIFNQVQLAFLVPFLSAISFGVICVPLLPSTLEHLRVGASDGVILSPRDFTPMPTLPIPDELVFKQPPRIDSSIIFNQVQLAFLVPFLSAISFGVICVPSLPSTLEHLRVSASDGVILSPRDFTPMPTLPIPDELVFKQPPGSTAASSSTKSLRSQRSPNQFSGHGNSASVQALNRFPFAMQVQLAFLVPFLSAISFGVICVPLLPSTLEHLRVGASDGVILSPRDFTPMPTLPIPDELVFKQPPRIDSSIIFNQVFKKPAQPKPIQWTREQCFCTSTQSLPFCNAGSAGIPRALLIGHILRRDMRSFITLDTGTSSRRRV
ncbi:hypothetical protein MTO96_017951 [Rhipicephalus appendiculatus]